MAPSDRGILIVGYGPGNGAAVAALFASKGFNKVALISRTSHDPKEITKSWKSDADVKSWAVDITNHDQYTKTLTIVQEFVGNLTCVVYNAARITPTELLQCPAEEIRQDLEINVISLYTTVQWANHILQKSSDQPSFLVTNSHLPESPEPPVFSLSMAKAAQVNLVKSLAQTFQDVHYALVNVRGAVSPDERNLNPTNIATKFWELYAQPREKWTIEINVSK